MNRLCERVEYYAPAGGRVLMAAIFVMSGWGKVTNFAGTAAYMAGKGMPFPELLLPGAIFVELAGSILLILGWQTRWAALVIFLFLIPTTLVFHNFWAVDAAQVETQTIQFMKNLAIMGGLLYVMAFGAGPLSLDNRRH